MLLAKADDRSASERRLLEALFELRNFSQARENVIRTGH
jgi:hypothetical protein